MSRTQMVLSRLLTKVDLAKPLINCPGPYWTVALFHVKSDKVWLMRSRSPSSVIERVKGAIVGGKNCIAGLPKSLRLAMESTADKKIDVYVGKSAVLTNSYIWAELAMTKALLPLIKSNGATKYSVWMIVHGESGHYKIHRTSADDPQPNEVLKDFMKQLRRCDDEDNVIGARTKKFVEAYPQAGNDLMQFTIYILGRGNTLAKANVLMNEKIRDYGYAKCLNMTGVSKSAKHS